MPGNTRRSSAAKRPATAADVQAFFEYGLSKKKSKKEDTTRHLQAQDMTRDSQAKGSQVQVEVKADTIDLFDSDDSGRDDESQLAQEQSPAVAVGGGSVRAAPPAPLPAQPAPASPPPAQPWSPTPLASSPPSPLSTISPTSSVVDSSGLLRSIETIVSDKGCAQAMDTKLTDLLNALPEVATPTIIVPEKSDAEAMFEQAATTGNFDLRSALGAQWSRALKENEKLRAQYSDVGKAYAQQRQFRARWAAARAEALRHERMQRVRSIDVDLQHVRYLPVAKIIAEEGGDESAKKAAANIVAKCVHMMQTGTTLRGCPGCSLGLGFRLQGEGASMFDSTHVRSGCIFGDLGFVSDDSRPNERGNSPLQSSGCHVGRPVHD